MILSCTHPVNIQKQVQDLTFSIFNEVVSNLNMNTKQYSKAALWV